MKKREHILPRFYRHLIESILPLFVDDSALGDYGEIYSRIRAQEGVRNARRWLRSQILRMLFPSLLNTVIWRFSMLRNHLKIAFRTLFKSKGYSIINIAGLAVGLACCLLVILYVQDELSYDRFHENAERIYRVKTYYSMGGREGEFPMASVPMAGVLMEEFPEVISAVRLRDQGSFVLRVGDRGFKENRVLYADSTFFKVFSFPLIAGDPDHVLGRPNTIAVSRSTALKYFGEEDAVGKNVLLDNEKEVHVTGVFEDMPTNSHFHADILISTSSIAESFQTFWLNTSYITYLLTHEGVSAESIESKFPAMKKKYIEPQVQGIWGKSYDELFSTMGLRIDFSLQALTDIHLHSDLAYELEPNGDIGQVRIFILIAFFILLIACFNFMNLATARSGMRAKEVGIRKTVGSYRSHIIRQFYTEAMVMSIAAALLAVLLVMLVLPFFNQLSAKAFTAASLTMGVMPGLTIAVVLLVGFLAGSYPAFFISSFHPVAILKDQKGIVSKNGTLRAVLVVFQFTASVFLIIGTLVVYRQLHYMQEKDVGFKKDHALVLRDVYLLGDRKEAFKNEILKHPMIVSATISDYLPIPSDRSSSAVFPDGNLDAERSTPVNVWEVDYDYIETMNMRIVEGRSFSRDFSTDEEAMLINEAAAAQFGWEDPIDRIIAVPASLQSVNRYTVVGVIEDFHFESLRNTIAPVVMYIASSTDNMVFRYHSVPPSEVVSLVRETWDRFVPGEPFDYGFMEEQFDALHRAEMRVGRILSIFAGMAIFIGCLGLLGLAAFMAERRTKEIGIRKALGASVSGVMVMLSKEFAKWVIIANLIAWPASYFFMNRWLNQFAYRMDLAVWIFLISGMAALTIALGTVSFQAVRAARTNPVESLRYE